MRRRDFVTGLAAATSIASAQPPSPPVPRKGRLKQCLTRGVFDAKMPFEDVCREAARLGCQGFDLAPAQNWPILKKYGLIPTMRFPNTGVSIPDGINRKDVQDELVKSMGPAIDECAAGGLNYHFVAQTIAELGFTGYIAHEYKLSPGRDGVQALNQAIEIMDV